VYVLRDSRLFDEFSAVRASNCSFVVVSYPEFVVTLGVRTL